MCDQDSRSLSRSSEIAAGATSAGVVATGPLIRRAAAQQPSVQPGRGRILFKRGVVGRQSPSPRIPVATLRRAGQYLVGDEAGRTRPLSHNCFLENSCERHCLYSSSRVDAPIHLGGIIVSDALEDGNDLTNFHGVQFFIFVPI
jgi:hypothetical protein